MKQKIILRLIRFLMRFIVGYHLHRDPIRKPVPKEAGGGWCREVEG